MAYQFLIKKLYFARNRTSLVSSLKVDIPDRNSHQYLVTLKPHNHYLYSHYNTAKMWFRWVGPHKIHRRNQFVTNGIYITRTSQRSIKNSAHVGNPIWDLQKRMILCLHEKGSFSFNNCCYFFQLKTLSLNLHAFENNSILYANLQYTMLITINNW